MTENGAMCVSRWLVLPRLLRRAVVLAIVPALLLSPLPSRAQRADTLIVNGRITTARGAAAADAEVIATLMARRVTVRDTADGDGRYRLLLPADTGLLLVVVSAQGWQVTRESRRVGATDARITLDVRLRRMVNQLATITVKAEQPKPPLSSARGEDVGDPGRRLSGAFTSPRPGGATGELSAVAAAVAGADVQRSASGDISGISFAGLGPSQTLTTIDGLPSTTARLPADARVSASVSRAPYDVSAGGFAGGLISVDLLSGSNLTASGARVVMQGAGLTAPRAHPEGRRTWNLRASGYRSGPIKLDRAFYQVVGEANYGGQQLSSLVALSPQTLAARGLAADSLRRLLGVLDSLGLEVDRGEVHGRLFRANGLAKLDLTTSHNTRWSLTADADVTSRAPAQLSSFSIPAAQADSRSFTGGLRARRSGYAGAWLHETAVGSSVASSTATPRFLLPEGVVALVREGDEGTEVGAVRIGGIARSAAGSRTASIEAKQTSVWEAASERHRVSVTASAWMLDAVRSPPVSSPGSFRFSSIDSLALGLPSMFERTVGGTNDKARRLLLGLSLGDVWQPGRSLTVQYGARMDVHRFHLFGDVAPEFARLTRQRAVDAVTSVALSPRAAIDWRLGGAEDREPTFEVRGGLGRFVGTLSPTRWSDLGGDGHAESQRLVRCVGNTVPQVDWSAFSGDPQTIPEECTSVVASMEPSGIPSAGALSATLRPPSSWRSSISAQWLRAGPFIPGVEVVLSSAQHLPTVRDVNLPGVVAFQLAGEDDRPVFAAPDLIDASSGAIMRAPRNVPQLNQALVLTSEGRNQSLQATASLIRANLGGSFVRLAYTWSRIRELQNGLEAATGGAPTALTWAPSAASVRHSFRTSVIAPVHNLGTLTLFGDLSSGYRFTPLVASDLNGDGWLNDAAFVPKSLDAPGVGQGELTTDRELSALLARTASSTSACLRRQRGQIAARNSCVGPWHATLDGRVVLDAAGWIPSRATISFDLLNIPAGLDRLLHGASDLHGWGQPAFADPYLFTVRSFDPAGRKFTYNVNPEFGVPRRAVGAFALPFVLRIDVRVALQEDYRRQEIEIERRRDANPTPERLLSRYIGRYPSPVDAVVQGADSLSLRASQQESLKRLATDFDAGMLDIWTPVSRRLAGTGHGIDMAVGLVRAGDAQAVELYEHVSAAVRALLTPTQIRHLSAEAEFLLNPQAMVLMGRRPR